MFDLPFHPLVIHFPIVLATFLPFFAAYVLWHIRRHQTKSLQTWAFWVIFQALLAVSALVSVKTGELDEEKIENRVPEAALESHEELGERFALVSGATTVLAFGGFLPAPIGPTVRVLTLAASAGQFALMVPLGHSGAEMVHGQTASVKPMGDRED
jgi:uncharacterized membrane protein